VIGADRPDPTVGETDDVLAPWRGAEVVQLMGDTAFGGGAHVVLGICDACRSLGLKPVVLATNPELAGWMEQHGVEVWRFPGIVREPRPIHDLATAVRLSRALKGRGVRIVHTHTSKGGMVGRLGARLAGCPVVIHHTHSLYPTSMAPGPKRMAMMALEAFFARLDDLQVFVNSAEESSAVEKGVVPRARARLAPNGIHDPVRDGVPDPIEVRSRLGLPAGARLVGTVARLAPDKALDVGIEAFSRIAATHPGLCYVIFGEGEDRDRLEELVRDLDLTGRVHLPGHDPDAARLGAVLDIVLFPSRREGQSISLMEAMACGTPIVATDILGNVDLLRDGETALVCPVDDAASMAAAMERLLTDPGLAERLGTAARERFETEFTYDRFLTRIRALYAEALSMPRRTH
jgi:glycosyltransferase involved in cell wall biosynthesis